MGWKTARVSLVAEGVKQVVEIGPNSPHADGQPVQIISFTEAHSHWRGVEIPEFRKWLEAIGFKHDGISEFKRDDISVLIDDRNGMVRSVLITFQVELDARIRRQSWLQCVKEFCAQWQFHLVDENGNTVDATQFYAIFEETFAWKCFLQREGGIHGKSDT